MIDDDRGHVPGLPESISIAAGWILAVVVIVVFSHFGIIPDPTPSTSALDSDPSLWTVLWPIVAIALFAMFIAWMLPYMPGQIKGRYGRL